MASPWYQQARSNLMNLNYPSSVINLTLHEPISKFIAGAASFWLDKYIAAYTLPCNGSIGAPPTQKFPLPNEERYLEDESSWHPIRLQKPMMDLSNAEWEIQFIEKSELSRVNLAVDNETLIFYIRLNDPVEILLNDIYKVSNLSIDLEAFIENVTVRLGPTELNLNNLRASLGQVLGLKDYWQVSATTLITYSI